MTKQSMRIFWVIIFSSYKTTLKQQLDVKNVKANPPPKHTQQQQNKIKTVKDLWTLRSVIYPQSKSKHCKVELKHKSPAILISVDRVLFSPVIETKTNHRIHPSAF